MCVSSKTNLEFYESFNIDFKKILTDKLKARHSNTCGTSKSKAWQTDGQVIAMWIFASLVPQKSDTHTIWSSSNITQSVMMPIEHSWTIHILVKQKLKICLEILISLIINVANASQSLAKLKYRTENRIKIKMVHVYIELRICKP